MGTLAGPRLRKLRGLAHEAVDPLWQDGGALVDRDMFYRIAGEVMGVADLHVGNLDEHGCLRLIERVPAIQAALDRHAALVLQPSDSVELDPDTRDLLQVLFEAPDGGVVSKLLPLDRLVAIGVPVQDLRVQGVLAVGPTAAAKASVSLTQLGARLLLAASPPINLNASNL